MIYFNSEEQTKDGFVSRPIEMEANREIVIIRSATELVQWRANLVSETEKPLLGFVPTMGYLHEGHLALIHEAKRHAQYVIVSIFVNPTQFNSSDDFEHYPRDEEGDIKAAHLAGADAVFMPTKEVIYPQGAQTWVNVGSLGSALCGATRPGHFQGVCTVVTALFNLVQCQIAVFGEKDYQQVTIIRQIARDLHLPVQIISLPTVREADGLAMSSRNARLSFQGRQQAAGIYQGLLKAKESWNNEIKDIKTLTENILSTLPPMTRIDYLTFCDPSTLVPLESLERQSKVLLAIACFIEDVRLIDNIVLS